MKFQSSHPLDAGYINALYRHMIEKHQRRYRVSFEVNQSLMETIFDLLKGDATNFRMMEVPTNGVAQEPAGQHVAHRASDEVAMAKRRASPAPPEPFVPQGAGPDMTLPPRAVDVPTHRPHRFPKDSDAWALKTWHIIKPAFDATHPNPIMYNDQRILMALVKAGHSAATASPLLSALRRLGKLRRTGRGWYQMV